jgi:hypothetical protein
VVDDEPESGEFIGPLQILVGLVTSPVNAQEPLPENLVIRHALLPRPHCASLYVTAAFGDSHSGVTSPEVPSRLKNRFPAAVGGEARTHSLAICMLMCISSAMEFVWDERKRKANIRKHGLDFVDAKTLFDGVTVTFEDDRFLYGENRFITLGILRGMVVVIAHTESDDLIRLISMRRATRHEQRIFFQRLTD